MEHRTEDRSYTGNTGQRRTEVTGNTRPRRTEVKGEVTRITEQGGKRLQGTQHS